MVKVEVQRAEQAAAGLSRDISTVLRHCGETVRHIHTAHTATCDLCSIVAPATWASDTSYTRSTAAPRRGQSNQLLVFTRAKAIGVAYL